MEAILFERLRLTPVVKTKQIYKKNKYRINRKILLLSREKKYVM